MPDLCQLRTTVYCPNCGSNVPAPAGVVRFQWGEVPRDYRDGDDVAWLVDSAGHVVPSFVLVRNRDQYHWNYGDPQCRDVLAFDIDPHEPEMRCVSCGALFEGIAARVVDGRFDGAIGFLPGSIVQQFGVDVGSFDVAVREPTGGWRARTDWFNPILTEAGQGGAEGD
ncbi:hypothetical protein [Sorangium sp. So ce1024]|uniref:hypothetical protein n=1 Tax=Sorangium sp. So ce1024 TaxID=3133327 RepID=UPI003F09C573